MKEKQGHSDQPFDDRAEVYAKSGDMVAAIARHHHHIDIDSLTHTRWRQLMGLMREVDTWADDTDATHVDVIEGLATFDMFRDRYPDLAPEALSETAQHAVIHRTIRIFKLGQRAAQATTPMRYVAMRILEARESVNLFADTATTYVTEQPGFHENFMPTLRSLGEAATLWDSIIDGKKDVRTGKQILVPDAEYYTRLTRAMLRRTKRGGPGMLHIEPNVHLGIKVGKRIANRLKNGVPEYSSLRIFSRKQRD